MDVYGGDKCAGIGRNGNGNIEIHSGNITATGGVGGAGIGGDLDSPGGMIIISGGIVKATGGTGGAGIGGGSGGDGGNLLVYGASTQIYPYAGLGAQTIGEGAGGAAGKIFAAAGTQKYGDGSDIGNAVVFTANPMSSEIVKAILPEPFSAVGPIDLLSKPDADGKIKRIYTTLKTEIIELSLAEYSNSPVKKTGSELYASGATVAFEGQVDQEEQLLEIDGGNGYTYANNTLFITQNGAYTIKNKGSLTRVDHRISVAEGVEANITLAGVNIDVSGIDNACALDLSDAGATTVILAEGYTNTLRSGNDKPGIHVPDGHKLTIDGSGTLYVYGGERCSGIGRKGNGIIEILNGNITATGSPHGAGIGGCDTGSGGSITISGGTVSATGGEHIVDSWFITGSAGIGGGSNGDGGKITIRGGNVIAIYQRADRTGCLC